MFEVEAKVPISAAQAKALKERLNRVGGSRGHQRKIDTYYGNPRKVFIRLRAVGKKRTFSIKLRRTERGVERNLEMEWGIKNLASFSRFLKKTGLKATVRKEKHSTLYQKGGFGVELNRVRGLGYFLEIEKCVKREGEIEKTHKALVSLFKELGFTPRQFEKRPYLQLLSV